MKPYKTFIFEWWWGELTVTLPHHIDSVLKWSRCGHLKNAPEEAESRALQEEQFIKTRSFKIFRSDCQS